MEDITDLRITHSKPIHLFLQVTILRREQFTFYYVSYDTNAKNCLYFTKKIVFVVPKLFWSLAPGIKVQKECVKGDTWPSAFGT
jgi:hypothetical protein